MKMGGLNCKRRLLQQRSKTFIIIQHWHQIADWLEILNRRPEGLPISAQKRREAVLVPERPREKGKEGKGGKGGGGNGLALPLLRPCSTKRWSTAVCRRQKS